MSTDLSGQSEYCAAVIPVSFTARRHRQEPQWQNFYTQLLQSIKIVRRHSCQLCSQKTQTGTAVTRFLHTTFVIELQWQDFYTQLLWSNCSNKISTHNSCDQTAVTRFLQTTFVIKLQWQDFHTQLLWSNCSDKISTHNFCDQTAVTRFLQTTHNSCDQSEYSDDVVLVNLTARRQWQDF